MQRRDQGENRSWIERARAERLPGVDPVTACLDQIAAWRARNPDSSLNGMQRADAHYRERDQLAVAIATRDDCDMGEACVRARCTLERWTPSGSQVDLFA